jgi:DNA (cytosine-5)-methyltransferase 1
MDAKKIVLSVISEKLISNKSLEPKFSYENLLSAFQNTKILSDVSRILVNEHSSLPKESYYKGQKIGPILKHLIDQASTIYNVSKPTVLNSADFGAPQSRKRLFLIGLLKQSDQYFSFPEGTYKCNRKKSISENQTSYRTVKDAISDLPDVDVFEHLMEDDKLERKHLKTPQSDLAKELRLEVLNAEDHSLPRVDWNPFFVSNQTRTLHAAHVLKRLSNIPEGQPDKKSHRPRLHRDKPSNTLRAGTREGKGSHTAVRPIHYEYDRVITVREGARLMGYPDWMEFHKAKWHGMRLVGNGVPSHLGAAVARSIMDLLRVK